MSNKLSFNEVKRKKLSLLQQYIPVVSKVHGGSHLEIHDVHKVSDNYTVPNDVCETYKAVYNMLAELDKAYGG